jgi:hypothetical protein
VGVRRVPPPCLLSYPQLPHIKEVCPAMQG